LPNRHDPRLASVIDWFRENHLAIQTAPPSPQTQEVIADLFTFFSPARRPH
jgi:hypothetical protein